VVVVMRDEKSDCQTNNLILVPFRFANPQTILVALGSFISFPFLCCPATDFIACLALFLSISLLLSYIMGD
jgi:hypothetical protein